MEINLIESVKGFFTRDTVSQTAAELGEDEEDIQKAISAAIPTSMVGMLSKAGNGGSSDLLDMSKRALSSNVLGNLKRFFGTGASLGTIPSLANGLFGDKLCNIIKTISGYSGIREASASSIMNLAAPTVLATIGREVSSPGGLVSVLDSEKDSILSSVPSGLNVAGALGFGSLNDIAGRISSSVSNVTSGTSSISEYAMDLGGETVQFSEKKTSWLWPLVLLAAMLLAAWYFFGKGCITSTVSLSTDSSRDKQSTTVSAPMTAIRVKLPDGTELDAIKGGIEDRMVAFLESNWETRGDEELKNTWFDFDNLNFETGSANITAESMTQINNIAAIIKAFPRANFKIGGYTDKVGNDTANKILSQQRAAATATALKNAGADPLRIVGVEGYGEDYAIVEESAPDAERKKDRRIAVSVRR